MAAAWMQPLLSDVQDTIEFVYMAANAIASFESVGAASSCCVIAWRIHLRREVASSQSLHKVPLETRDRHSLLPSQILHRVLQDSQGHQLIPGFWGANKSGWVIIFRGPQNLPSRVAFQQQPTASSKHAQFLHDAKSSHATPQMHASFVTNCIKLRHQ